MAASNVVAKPAWARSLAAFKLRLSAEDKQMFEFTTWEGLQESIKEIQEKQVHRRAYRNLNKIKPFLLTLQQYSLVIEQFVNAKSDFLAFIWGPIKLCLQIASRVVEAFDCLLDAYTRIGEALPVLSAVDRLFENRSHDHVQQILANVYEDILTFHQRAVVFFKQRAWTIVFKTAIRSFGDMFDDVVKNLQRSKELLVQTASVWHFQNAQDARLLMIKQFEALREKDEQDRRLNVVNWLSPVSCQFSHECVQGRRRAFPDTTRWIFETTVMHEWIRGDEASSPILWLSGIPGAGKTFIFSSIVDEMTERFPTSHVVYFYCQYNDPQRATFNSIARGLIAQVLASNPICLEYLYEKAVGSGELSPSSVGLCTELLEQLATHHDQLLIGIDGLDECEESERRYILAMLHSILKATNATRNVKIFLTSCKEPDLKQSLRFTLQLEIKEHHLKKDITSYVRQRVSELSAKFKLDVEYQTRAAAEIVQRSHGMFLLPRLILDNLMEQDCRDDVKEELSNEVLPDGIDQAYGRILVRMKRKHQSAKTWERAKLGLDMITVAKRPVKTYEIQGTLSISLEKATINFEEHRSRRPLAELLGLMVEIHTDDSVTLIHPTARDYLLQHHSNHFIDAGAAELRMARLCTSYLTFNCFEPFLDEPNIEKAVHRGDYAFQEYATFHWVHHVGALAKYCKVKTGIDISTLRDSTALLHMRLIEQYVEKVSDSSSGVIEADRQTIFEKCREIGELYDKVDTIYENETLQESFPYLFRRISKVRTFLENLSHHTLDASPTLREAYGKLLYKCPVISCTCFYQGFANSRLRDEHLKRHDRAHKCINEGCDYYELGFTTRAELTRHVQLCHETAPEEAEFPKVQPLSLSKALNDAIDRDDASAVRDICGELLVHPIEETGFLFRAVKRKSISAALTLVELLGTAEEVNHKDKNRSTALHEAVAIEHDDLVKQILNTDVDVNAQDGKKDTPFLLALKHGNFEAVRLLLNHSALDLSPKNSNFGLYEVGMKKAAAGGHDDVLRALFGTFVELSSGIAKSIHLPGNLHRIATLAASNKHESTVRLILELGRKFDVEKQYRGLLKNQISNGIEAVVKLLMERFKDSKPEVDKKGKSYGNALAKAAMKGDKATVVRLLKKGADIDYICRKAYNALQAAVKASNLSMVHFLLEKGADVNVKGGGWRRRRGSASALYLACEGGQLAIVQTLLSAGANVDAFGKGQETALEVASRQKYEDIVRLLLEKGADANIQHGTALSHACSVGYEAIVRLLLEKGADVNIQSEGNGTPLSRACLGGSEAIVRLLLEKGADVDAPRGSLNLTPLSSACSRGHEAIIQLLLENGADINLRDSEQRTALHEASRSGNKDIVQLLLEKGADINLRDSEQRTALHEASRSGNKDIVQLLLEKGVDIHLRGSEQRTALHEASRSGNKDIVQLLLEKGADINLRDSEQRTALYEASRSGNKDIVQLLLEKGADIHLQDYWQRTALHEASRSGNKDIVQLLLEKGADIHLQDYWQRTALHEASRSGNKDIVQLLLDKGADMTLQDKTQGTRFI